MTRRTLEAVRQLGAATGSRERLPQLRVIAGAANPDPAGIAAAAAAPELEGRVEIVRAAREMRPHLEWADLAVTSGGSTVWELARLGCPMLVVETVPAEELLVAGLAQVGLGDHLGHERDLGTQALADAIAARIDDAAWRAGMSERGRRLVDGQGAPRVAGVLAQAS
jgi:UDP-2,4-diacetamido-2,4,6-trideoxy-beta-L-altropyranose hydrolase